MANLVPNDPLALKDNRYSAAGRSGSGTIYDAHDEGEAGMDNLPGWATWTADEAVAWIDGNVKDLASAKAALRAMSQAIIYLRDMA
jgi:hypothetical protein